MLTRICPGFYIEVNDVVGICFKKPYYNSTDIDVEFLMRGADKITMKWPNKDLVECESFVMKFFGWCKKDDTEEQCQC